jgi:hypothetical protein
MLLQKGRERCLESVFWAVILAKSRFGHQVVGHCIPLRTLDDSFATTNDSDNVNGRNTNHGVALR